MEIKIISEKRTIFQGQGKSIVLPGKRGQFQVLENHANIFSVLGKGEIVVETEKGKKSIFISSGILELVNNKVTILIQSIR